MLNSQSSTTRNIHIKQHSTITTQRLNHTTQQLAINSADTNAQQTHITKNAQSHKQQVRNKPTKQIMIAST